jgi:hypothetical protein
LLIFVTASFRYLPLAPVVEYTCVPSLGLKSDQLSRCTYHDHLRGMWLGQAIANWTGLTTEAVRTDAPFYTDENWGDDQNLSWKMEDRIDFTFQDPWLADDDTDIEYVYLHLLTEHATHRLTAEQIAAGWRSHINDYIWVSNAEARGLMERGVLPPVTSMGAVNEHFLQIDAQLTTEIFGALAPRMPEQALQMADLPIRTTAGGYAAHAAQFYVLLYSLALEVDPSLSPERQNIWLVQEARRYLPDTSKTTDVIDFVLADYLANPDKDDWERTRNRIYERYQANAGNYGFVYRDWTESSINLATGVLALLYGGGDFRRTVQIGTLAGWDSDNGTATVGGLLGLMQGYDRLVAQFAETQISDRYHIHRTRPTMPDYLPADTRAEDTFSQMAERMLPIIEQLIMEAGGQVHDDVWILPDRPADSPLELNPLERLMRRSANYRVMEAGGTIVMSISGEVAQSRLQVIADGVEHDFSGQELRRLPRAYSRSINNTSETITLTITYDRDVEIAVIRLIEGDASALVAIEAQILLDGQWYPVPDRTIVSHLPDPAIPYQMIEFVLPQAVMARGIRLETFMQEDARLAEMSILELDVLSR